MENGVCFSSTGTLVAIATAVSGMLSTRKYFTPNSEGGIFFELEEQGRSCEGWWGEGGISAGKVPNQRNVQIQMQLQQRNMNHKLKSAATKGTPHTHRLSAICVFPPFHLSSPLSPTLFIHQCASKEVKMKQKKERAEKNNERRATEEDKTAKIRGLAINKNKGKPQTNMLRMHPIDTDTNTHTVLQIIINTN